MPRFEELFGQATGFIFDCDGTLLDSMGAWTALEERFFAEAAIPFTEEQKDEVRAVPFQDSVAIFHAHGVGESPQHVLQLTNEALLNFYRNQVQPFEGACEFVRLARSHGIGCTVVSSSPIEYVQAGLERAGIADEFAEIVTTQAVGISKQDPRIYLRAIDTMKANVATTWGFDDALYAIRAMNATGLCTCACYDSDEVGTFEQLAEAAAVAIRSFTELL